jgi:hypothetical protein
MKAVFETPVFRLDGSNGGQKRRFMTIRKWCRISGPCRHYYIAKSDIFIFIEFFDRKEPLLWRILAPKRSLFFHETPTDFVKSKISVKKLKILSKSENLITKIDFLNFIF